MKTIVLAGIASMLMSAVALAQADNRRPEIWYSQSKDGKTVIVPGTGQDVQTQRSGKTEYLNYDTKPAGDSVYKRIPDPKTGQGKK